MGACASCLGLNRHPSHHQQESDPLLDNEQIAHYGAANNDDLSPIHDEEEVRRERAALEQISARASDNMIDVLHADHVEDGQHLAPNLSFLSLSGLQHKPAASTISQDQEAIDDTEQAWLRDLSASETDPDVTVKGSYGGNLVIDLSRLREDGQASKREL